MNQHKDTGNDTAISAAEHDDVTDVLIIGFGNLSRRDDGVAYHIIRRIRERLGVSAEPEDLEADEVPLGNHVATMVLHQLAPELATTLARYSAVVFLDAHVAGTNWADVHWQEVVPAYSSGMVSHHLKPASTLALCRTLYNVQPQGYILSVLGVDFDFGEELSEETAGLAERAATMLLGQLRAWQVIGDEEPGSAVER